MDDRVIRSIVLATFLFGVSLAFFSQERPPLRPFTNPFWESIPAPLLAACLPVRKWKKCHCLPRASKPPVAPSNFANSKKGMTPQLLVFDSPEKAFHAYLTGVVTEDFDLMLSSLTPEAKAYHIGLAVFSAYYLFSEDPEMQQVLREHGLEPSAGNGKVKEEMDPIAAEKAMVSAILKIKNPAKLMRRIADKHEKLAELWATLDESQPKTKPPTTSELLLSVKLGRVAITDDSATATVMMAAPAKDVLSVPEKVEFRRIKNRWYCHIDPR